MCSCALKNVPHPTYPRTRPSRPRPSRRRNERIGSIIDLEDFLNPSNHSSVLHADTANQHILVIKQVLRSLRRTHASFKFTVGEADDWIAYLAKHQPDVAFVLALDSDFYLVDGIRYVPLDSLSFFIGSSEWIHGGLDLAPLFLGSDAVCVTAKVVAELLQIPTPMLSMFSSLAGDDFSSSLLETYKVYQALRIHEFPIGKAQTIHTNAKRYTYISS